MIAKEAFANGYRSIDDSIAKAISQFEKSRDLFKELGDATEAEIAELWAAQLFRDVASIAESRRRLTTIIDSAEKKKFKILVPPSFYWLAMSEYHENKISESNKHLKVALRAAEAGNNSFEVQHIQEALAEAYSELNEYEPALFYASKMLTDRGLYYQVGSQYWRDKGTLTELAVKLKFFSTALSLASESLSFALETPSDSTKIIDSLSLMISVAAAKGDFGAALKYANQSMKITRERSNTPEKTRAMANIYLIVADIKRKARDCDGAITDYDNSLEQFRLIPEITDSLYQIHKGKLFCFQQLNRQDDFSTELETVLKLSEEYRTTIREDDTRQAVFANEQDVFDAATANAIRQNDSVAAFRFVEKSKARSLLDFVESDSSIKEVEMKFGIVSQPLSLPEIQARLPEQVQLVQYSVLPNSLAIWIVSKTRFEFVEKQITGTDLEKKVDAYEALIVTKGQAADIRRLGQELYELLIPQSLATDKQLCLIPDKSLHQLAFASLVSSTGKYLLEDYALSYAPSASVMLIATENAHLKQQVTNESLLSIGNPDFDREENPNLADLKDAGDEAKAIATGYPKAQEFIGSAATKDMFLLNFRNVEVIHFAGHFIANPQSSGNSKLLFTNGDLRTSELSDYKLPKAKLVVLSACETGFERYNKSEGAIGIARTLLALGAPIVVASQWKVDSEPTKDLMIAFHRNRKRSGLTSAESLRRAQLEVLSREATKAPFYWAAFSMFGGYANY